MAGWAVGVVATVGWAVRVEEMVGGAVGEMEEEAGWAVGVVAMVAGVDWEVKVGAMVGWAAGVGWEMEVVAMAGWVKGFLAELEGWAVQVRATWLLGWTGAGIATLRLVLEWQVIARL